MLDQREMPEIQETQEHQEGPDLRDPRDSTELPVDPDRPVSEAQTEHQALLADLVSPELREKLA